MPQPGADLAEMLASMPELQALLRAERDAAQKARAASEQRITELEKQRESAARQISELEKERDNLRRSHELLRIELELFKRRIFIAKAERADNEQQLRIEYEQKLRELDALAGTLGIAKSDEPKSDNTPASDGNASSSVIPPTTATANAASAPPSRRCKPRAPWRQQRHWPWQ